MSSDGVEHLSSVHDNPFIRQYGLHQNATRQEPPDSESSIPSSASSDRGDDDTEQEYHVNSGFVNKLRSKFAQLENKSHKVTLSKKSASVENLLNIGSSNDVPIRSRKWQLDDASVTTSGAKVDLRKLAPAGYKPQIRNRPGSCDLETKPKITKKKEIEFLRQNNVLRSVKPPLPTKTSVDSSRNKRYSRKTSSDNIVPKIEHHDWKVAPDLEKIGRDNIVIIESKQPVETVRQEKTKTLTDKGEDAPDGFRRVKPLTEKEQARDKNELPKPNTVSQFRTLFEKTNKTIDTLNVWRQQSPPRKSSGSDANSPIVTSPVSTPRSPLKANDENVFEDSLKISNLREKNKPYSPRNSSNLDPNVSSPRNSSSFKDYSQNVDTTPTSIQKSLEMFNRRGSVDQEQKSDSNRNSYSEKDTRPLSPSIQHTLTPNHQMSNIFDSKSLPKKSDMSKRQKPTTLAKKPHPVPKDTLELKHEADRLAQELTQQKKKANLKIDIIEEAEKIVTVEPETVSEEPNVKPSSKSSGKISPRKTKVFDSSNIVKKHKEPPKVSQSNNKDFSSTNMSNNVPKQVSIEIKDIEGSKAVNENETEVAMETSPIKPLSNKKKTGNSGLTELKPNIIDKADNKPKPRKFKVKEQNFIKAESVNEQEKVKPQRIPSPEQTEAPVSGMSSFLASRLKKTKPDQENQLKTSSVHLANGSSPSPVPKKRQAPERPVSNGSSMEVDSEKTPPPLPVTPEPLLPKSNIDDVIIRQKKKNTQQTTKMVFDSSKIATKRKEPPKRKPPRKTLEQLNQSDSNVPKLDLSSITGDQQETEYQEGYIPTIIKPCPYKFVGAEVTFEKTPYKKKRKSKKVVFEKKELAFTKSCQTRKAKISFDDHATTTFEYEGEDSALASYLEDHPDERDDALKQDEEVNGVSDGPVTHMMNDSPAVPLEPETHMKSNTVIGTSGGGFTSYKSKIQTQDFQFGMNPEPEVTVMPYSEPQDELENIDLLPADESELDTFSAELEKSDMLF